MPDADELAVSEARQRAVLDAALDCVVSVDHRGCVTYFNPAAERTFGYRADDVIGRELAEVIVPPDLRQTHRQGLARHLATGEQRVLGRRIELRALRADGSEFPVELTVTRVDTPGDPLFTAYVRDITERRQSEAELAAARERLEFFAEEHVVLARVAMLVAEGASPDDVFDAVCQGTGELLGASDVKLDQFTPDGFSVTLAGWSARGNDIPIGMRLPLEGESISAVVARTLGPSASRSAVGAPVAVNGSVWGALIVGADGPDPLPAGADMRLASFAGLIGTAIANASARSELIGAQRRVIEAGDAARARLTRDIHDGAQQQFVNTLINLQLAQQKLSLAPERARELLDLAAGEAVKGLNSLRDLAAGLHPAILTDRGLEAALDALVEASPVPVSVEIAELELATSTAASLYFLCSEALTNVFKHAKATAASIKIARSCDQLVVAVADDGIGGAQFDGSGSGLRGLADRVAALEGTMDLRSPRDGKGTTLTAIIPLVAGSSRQTGSPLSL